MRQPLYRQAKSMRTEDSAFEGRFLDRNLLTKGAGAKALDAWSSLDMLEIPWRQSIKSVSDSGS